MTDPPTKSIADFYTYKVIYSDEDHAYMATCAEFPSLSWSDEDEDVALEGMRNMARQVVEDMDRKGETIPSPPQGFAR